ncbi:MAG: tRNA preQ1(34) S-adenosylmethionine ribosyltransferase-isomerase QueA [Planctomycetota bacterium]|nr:tRNA preQ1(34) S-adenosylmethionine ribosyltransferase-isomerase QueA [Planctomycetota bacterium]
MTPKTSDFDYDLPGKLIAQKPAERRDQSRLMVLDRSTGCIGHHIFSDLPSLLGEGDLLVLNDTRVVPAKFFCRRQTGGRIEGLFLRELSPGLWEVMLKRAGRCKVGEELILSKEPPLSARLEARPGGDLPSGREGLWHLTIVPPYGADEILGRIGATPLPPYIRRDRPDSTDRRAYQTIYADRPGAVAAPTAGLHFTEDVLADLRARKIESATVTLHVGLGTFAPVKTERLDRHKMHSEWYELPGPSADAVSAAGRREGKIVAVGTTSVRVLESAGGGGSTLPAGRRVSARTGWTDLFIYPPASFRMVDAMVTNFHLPRSTLLMLVAAFCSPGSTDGIKIIKDAYAEAIRKKYRFYSYGDAMLIL